VLGGVATALGLEAREALVDRVHVGREVVDLRHVDVAAVAVGDERDAQVGPGTALADAPRDRPDPPLGAFDEAAHAPGRVEHERHLDARRRGRHRGGHGRTGFAGEDEGDRDDGQGLGSEAHGLPPALRYSARSSSIPVSPGRLAAFTPRGPRE
jgi:hypothetical protein